MVRIALIFSLLLFNAAPDLRAQQLFCIDFENYTEQTLEVVQVSEEGSLFLTEQGISARLEPLGANNNTAAAFIETKLDQWAQWDADQRILAVQSGYVDFCFENLISDVGYLRFGMVDNSSNPDGFRISVNGAEEHIVYDFAGFPIEIAPGVTAVHNKHPYQLGFPELANGSNGFLELEGNIQSVRLGGANFFLDNICYAAASNQTNDTEVCFADACDFEIYEVFTGSCSDVGVYDVQFLVLPTAFPGDYYDVYINDQLIAAGQPVNVDYPVYQVPNSTQAIDVLTVCVTNQPDCCQTVEIEAPNCNCSPIHAVLLENQVCTDEGTFYTLQLDYTNHGSQIFTLATSTGAFEETYSYADLPVTIGPVEPWLSDNYLLLWAQDQTGNCNAHESFLYEPCEPTDDCIILNVLQTNVICHEDGSYATNLSVSHLNEGSATLAVYVDGVFHSYSFYSNTFVYVNNLTADGVTEHTIELRDTVYENCSFALTLPPQDCGIVAECLVGEVQVYDVECLENGTYNAFLDFEYINATNDHFDLWVNNEFYGYFPLEALPLPLENITPRPNSDDEHIQVCINDHPDCCVEYEYPDPECPDGIGDCMLSDLTVERTPCEEGTYTAYIHVSAENPGNDFFEVWVNNEYIGFYEWEAMPIAIENITPRPNSDYDIVQVCVNDIPECCITTEYLNDCATDDCILSDLNITNTECDDEQMFFAIVSFEYQNPSSETFSIIVNGENYGTFPYADLPVEVGPFSGHIGVPNEMLVFDSENEACHITTEFGAYCLDIACYGFDEEPLNTFSADNTNAGDVIFEYDDFNVAFDSFTYFDGSQGLWNVEVQEPFVNYFGGNALWISNSTIVLDFSISEEVPEVVTMYYFDGGGEENIAVNGNPPLVVNNFTEVPVAIADGVSFTHQIIEDLSNGFVTYGLLTFMGNIESIEIGGQEFYLDDICVQYPLPPTPPMSDVWPGDANNDNLVNHFDILNLGIAFGTAGPPRATTSDEWAAMPSLLWDNTFANGTNYHHADCNGDGVVNMEDGNIVSTNYGQEHGIYTPYVFPPSLPTDPPLWVELPDASAFEAGQAVMLPIRLGSDDTSIAGVYGLAFTVTFPEGVFQENTIELLFEDSWLGSAETLLAIGRTDEATTQMEIAVSRTDQTNVSGSGVMGYIIGIIDDVAGMTEIQVGVKEAIAIDADENVLALNMGSSTIDLTTNTTSLPTKHHCLVYPNPTTQYLFVQNQCGQEIQHIRVLNLLGQEMARHDSKARLQQLDVSGLSNGIYFLEVQYETGSYCEKFEVLY